MFNFSQGGRSDELGVHFRSLQSGIEPELSWKSLESLSMSPALSQADAQATAKASFDETVDLRLVLGTDPRRGDQAVRGTASLPHGTGRSVRVAVFADPDDAASAKAAGARLGASSCMPATCC